MIASRSACRGTEAASKEDVLEVSIICPPFCVLDVNMWRRGMWRTLRDLGGILGLKLTRFNDLAVRSTADGASAQDGRDARVVV